VGFFLFLGLDVQKTIHRTHLPTKKSKQTPFLIFLIEFDTRGLHSMLKTPCFFHPDRVGHD
jgi:hypothetical protein